MTGHTPNVTRREYVQGSAALLAGAHLAGCTSGGTGDGGSTPSGTTTDGTGTTSSTATAATSSENESTPPTRATTADTESTTAATETADGSVPSLSDDATEYLSDARSYAGDGPADHTGRSEVEVQNGAGSRGLAFDPPAIAVSAGTTVVWQWTGRGGDHDVVAVDGSFESELVESDSKTFSWTFENPGEWLYNCSEHEEKGMKGVVVVV